MDFCSRGGGVRSAQRCPDRLQRRQAFGAERTRRRARGGRTFRSRPGGRGRRPGSARSFGGFGAVSGGAGAAERTSTDEQTSGGTWRKKLSAAPGRQTEGEARRIRQRAQPAVSGLSDGGGIWRVRRTEHPGRRKIQPAVPEMSHEGGKTERRADFSRAGLSACFAGASGMAVFRAHGPVCGAVFVFFIKESGRSILRLRRRIRPC